MGKTAVKVVVSHYEVRPLWEAFQRQATEVETTPDLGRTRVRARLTPEGVHYPNGVLLRWEDAATILADANACYRVDGDGVHRLQCYSPVTGRLATLYPTGAAPTVLLSGIPMHRVAGTDPWRDTLAKVAAARPRGRVLDTCTGLGYTAIAAAERATFVLTVEVDPAVMAIARENPWSEALFTRPVVHPVLGDVSELVYGLPSGTFDVVIHDPPQFALAGELYSQAFYRELHRVLRSGGRLFHYVGSPERKMGRNVTRGVAERLRRAGFEVQQVPHAFGLVARKPR